MSDIVIKAESIGKKYLIGHQAERGGYTAFRDVLMQNMRTLWDKTKDLVKGKPIIQGDSIEEVWALKDVSFEIRRGEAVGIIGRNGAGKSTLLKVLSRITEPSTGRITIKGRVASLLEVGTGFHPELSGRENIYLNGTILGMTRKEIKQKFDEIVAFAEVEKYLDTPVKRYSSGMYVRLAFAVAAHLEPEILVVDEVLAVGDAQFQKKCLGKMENVAQEGRTVLFVSHNMAAISALCKICILLKDGKLVTMNSTAHTTEVYTEMITSFARIPIVERADDNALSKCYISEVWIENQNGKVTDILYSGESMEICIRYKSSKADPKLKLGVGIWHFGTMISYFDTLYSYADIHEITAPQCGVVVLHVPRLPLLPGRYNINLSLYQDGEKLQWIEDAMEFTVMAGDYYGTGKIPIGAACKVLIDHQWNIT